MTAITVKINENSYNIVREVRREGTSCPAPAGILTEAIQESGEDHSGTVTVVTPRNIYVYHRPSKFITAVQEVNFYASAEIVC